MALAPWRPALARALHRNRSQAYSRYPQLATIRHDGRPANRTVVFRGFLPETNCLTFVTDSRSEKVHQIGQNPAAELCWYFTQTREQFRLAGQAQVITHPDAEGDAPVAYRQTWEKLSENARQQFAWPHPGKPRATEGFDRRSLAESAPLKTFTVLIFDPDAVDHLELRGSPQNRYQYARQPDDTWETLAVNP